MAVAQDYTYLTESHCTVDGERSLLDLASSGGVAEHPWLFSGDLPAPGVQAQALLAVARCARTRFHQRFDPIVLDPVVTCHDGLLRFEALSSCAGVYLRHDAPMAESTTLQPGVTNVDFGTHTRNVLARVRSGHSLALNVGHDLLAISTDQDFAVERQVQLPVRWVKGFAEVAVAQRGLDCRFDLAGPLAVRFLRALPRSGQGLHVVPSAREPRWSGRPVAGSVPVSDPQRLQPLVPLVPTARHLTVYADGRGNSCWVLESAAGRTHLALTPAASRGFSGEGGTLEALAADDLMPVLDDLIPELSWQARLDPADLARRTGRPEPQVHAALDRLGAGGRAGFDVEAGAYFHRDLPYDLAKVPTLHPRLTDARALAQAGAVRFDGAGAAWVRSGEHEHRVRLDERPPVCTCTWWVRHQGSRGPCKHVLAAELVGGRLEDAE